MNLIFPVARVIEHLRAAVPQLKLVGASADLTGALATPPPATPAAYVLASSRGGKPQFSGIDGEDYQQHADAAIQVVPWVRNYAQATTGAGARADMDALVDAIGEALCDYQPSADFYPLWFDTYSDVHYDAGWLTGQITFRSEFHIKRTSP